MSLERCPAAQIYIRQFPKLVHDEKNLPYLPHCLVDRYWHSLQRRESLIYTTAKSRIKEDGRSVSSMHTVAAEPVHH